MVSVRGSIAVCFGLLAAGLLCAQEIQLRASVDRATVSENESFTYVLLMQGQATGEPDLTPLSTDFEVLQRSRNTSIQMASGQTTQLTEWRLQLMPRAAGAFTIPPLQLAGALSNPVEVQILPAVATDAPGEIFMEVEVEPSTAYVQSQVIYTLRLFRAVNTGRSSLTPPEVIGGEAIIVPLGEDREYRTVRDGQDFVVLERRYALFPQVAGEFTIQPLTFEAVVITASGFSSLQRFRSDALAMSVRPAVPPPPEHPDATWLPARDLTFTERWSGEPGEFTLGIPQTRTLLVEAEGVLETQLPELALAQTDGVKQYSDQPELSRESDAGGIHAARTEGFAVIAQSVGAVTIPAVELPWFNVVDETWEVARVEPRGVTVLASQEAAAQPVAQGPAESTSPVVVVGNERLWQGVSAGLLVAWFLTVLVFWRGGRKRGQLAPEPAAEAPRSASRRRLLREIRLACVDNDPARARDSLLAWAALRFPEEPKTLGSLAATAPERLAAAVQDLERSLYGRGRGNWDGTALKKALARADAVTRAGDDSGHEDLLPLYR